MGKHRRRRSRLVDCVGLLQYRRRSLPKAHDFWCQLPLLAVVSPLFQRGREALGLGGAVPAPAMEEENNPGVQRENSIVMRNHFPPPKKERKTSNNNNRRGACARVVSEVGPSNNERGRKEEAGSGRDLVRPGHPARANGKNMTIITASRRRDAVAINFADDSAQQQQ